VRKDTESVDFLIEQLFEPLNKIFKKTKNEQISLEKLIDFQIPKQLKRT